MCVGAQSTAPSFGFEEGEAALSRGAGRTALSRVGRDSVRLIFLTKKTELRRIQSSLEQKGAIQSSRDTLSVLVLHDIEISWE